MNEKFLKPYNPTESEKALYELWDKSGYFNPDNLPGDRTETFTIMLPPPNVTGVLHMGSALMIVLEDIFIRYKRMRGYRTLWLPGTDSAAIATQARVEKDIQKSEKKNRHDLGREELLKRIDAFIDENKATILSQIRSIGASVDWSRYAYTMDEARYEAVMTAFVRMYEAGLIYRGDRIVNWDPRGQTVISDDEIVYKEEKTNLYYLKYGPFTIATARPETKFGDKYVVMHPDDARYASFSHGQKIELEWINGPITATVIKDDSIDMEFGTGVMTITPWHDAKDFEIAERHKLEKQQIIDQVGKLLPVAGEFAGLKIADARAKIIEKMRAKGLVEKEEPYVHNIATAERTEGVVEPQIMRQWFVGVDKKFTIPHSEIPGIASGSETTLKEVMRRAVESGETKILLERFEKTYFHWINNLHDWCISRQIWFGHRIPAWYRTTPGTTTEEIYVGIKKPEGEGWTQDGDVLDTWFSSGLWTFSTLGWPKKTSDLERFHPTSVIETGYDILPFWVSRMILMSGFFLGQVPFKTVYFHGLVRDGQGRKISKSLGNNIDPVDMAAKYGTDAVRISLIIGMAPGTDSRISEDKIRGYKNFANKVWNITRFVLENAEQAQASEKSALTPKDFELLSEFRGVSREVTSDLENYRVDLAADKLYHYLWDRFAAAILEDSKGIFRSENTADIESRRELLAIILRDSLKLLHPFMPFVTEEIWQHLPRAWKSTELLMVESWPS